MSRMILPGGTIGILGSGQLGRMLAQSARQHGYRVVVFSPEAHSPAGQLADEELVAPYQDLGAVSRFSARVDVVTFEFENVPAATAKAAGERAWVRPSAEVLFMAQHRIREKTAVAKAGFDVTPFAEVRRLEDLDKVPFGLPAVLKTASAGYDGKGQRKVGSIEAAKAAFRELGEVECVLEAFVPFVRELSVVVARGQDGGIADYGVFENEHVDHILDSTRTPPRTSAAVMARALETARGIAEAVDLVGVACVELFETEDGTVLFNEMAPRPHNSGHLTIEAFETSQFEQQLRTVCGLPLGSTERRAPAAAMANLLGDLWTFDLEGGVMGEPHWAGALSVPGAHLHLYGKRAPRPGRKMGHVTALGATPEEAVARVREARSRLIARA